MKKEKKKIIYCLLLIILILSLFVILNYILFPKINKTESKIKIVKAKPNEEIVSEEIIDRDLDLNSDIIRGLKNKISVFDSFKAGSYYGYFYQSDYLDFNNMSDDAKVMIGITQNKNFSNDFINATYEAQAPDGNNLNVIILSKEEVQNGINSFFGPNTNYIDTDLRDSSLDYCGFSGFKFDNTRNVYMSNPITCEGFPTPYIDTKIINAHQSGKTIEITIKIAYINYEINNKGEITKYVYRNNNKINLLEKHSILTDNSYNINNILNKLDAYKFTFNLNSDNYYYFTKVEKV